MWRGQPLADFAYESFAHGEAARLEELRLEAIELRIDTDLVLGRHAPLIGELDALIALHPFRERLRGQLMVALYRSGRQADALDAYRQAREVLLEELGIDPSPALQRLQKGILAQDPALELPGGVAVPNGVARPAQDARSPATRVVLAEDHYLLREGMRQLLDDHRRGEILLNAVVQRLLDTPALPVEVGEHMESVGPRVEGGQHDRGCGQARWCGEAEGRSVRVEEASPWPTS